MRFKAIVILTGFGLISVFFITIPIVTDIFRESKMEFKEVPVEVPVVKRNKRRPEEPVIWRNPYVYSYRDGQWKDSNVCTLPKVGEHVLTSLESLYGEVKVFVHNPDTDTVSDQLYRYGNWESDILGIFDLFFSQVNDISFVDIGGNIGLTSLSVAKSGRKVLALEAMKTNVQHMCQSIQYNNFYDNMRVVFNAVGENNYPALMAKSVESIGVHIENSPSINERGINGRQHFQDRPVPMPTVMLDDLLTLTYFQSFNRTVIKIDVEGAEYYVMKGATEFLQDADVIAIIMRWQWQKFGDIAVEYIIGILTSFSFKAFDFSSYESSFASNTTDLQSLFIPLKGESFQSWPRNVIWIKST